MLTLRRCDSYNTAQLQILSEPVAETEQLQAQNTSDAGEVPPLEHGRGRPRHPLHHSRRHTTSAPPLAAIQRILERSSWPEAQNRTAHSVLPNTTAFTPSDSGSDPEDSMDTDGNESDVEFWGGESPRAQRSPGLQHNMAMDGSDEEEEEEEEDGSEDEDMSDDSEEEDADECNQMELVGHR